MKTKSLIEKIKHKQRFYFISPHLDDAVFSAGGMMLELLKLGKKVEVINIFTKADKDNSFSAKKYLKQIGYKNQITLYQKRVEEDKRLLANRKIKTYYCNQVDALWRKNDNLSNWQRFLGKFINEFKLLYPTYKFHVIGNKLHIQDEKLIISITQEILKLIKKNSIIFCPKGIGGHVDHVLANRIGTQLAKSNQVIYWTDLPYANKEVSGKRRGKAKKMFAFVPDYNQKIAWAKEYGSQYNAVFENDLMLKTPEHYYV